MASHSPESRMELQTLAERIELADLPFQIIISSLHAFITESLLTEQYRLQLKIDDATHATVTGLLAKATAFLNQQLPLAELEQARIAAWEFYDHRLEQDSPQQALLRLVVCTLYDQEPAEYDVYGAEAMLETIFSCLDDLGDGECRRYRVFAEASFLHEAATKETPK